MSAGTDETTPRVSVILGTRNRQSMLPAAIRGALGQTFTDFELLVLDDASDPPVVLPDDVAADPRVTLLRFDDHLGISDIRNEGLRRSRARYVAFLDDDDVWMTDHLRRVVEVLDASPTSVAGVYGGFEKWHEGRLRWTFLPGREDDLFSKLLARNVVHPTCSVMKRDLLIEAGYFDPSFERGEDWDLFLRLARTYDFVALPEANVRVGWHPPPREADLLALRMIRSHYAADIAALPKQQRRMVESHHQTLFGILFARMGRPAKARRCFARALMARPTRLEPLWHLPRTYLGEAAFERMLTRVRSVTHGAARVVGARVPVTRH